MAKAATFTDDFSGASVDTGKWELTSTPTVSGGAMLLNGTDEAKSLISYDLADSYFLAKVTMGSPVSGSLIVTMDGHVLAFAIDTQIVAVDFTSGLTITGGAITYNATNHAWLRMSLGSGTLTWATSPDGTTWTTLATAPYTGATDAFLGFAPSTGTMTIDKVNLPPVSASGGNFFPFFNLAPSGAQAEVDDPPSEAANRPANPMLIAYANSPATTFASAWAHPGALVVVGRANYNETWVHTMADAGATVLLYIDCLIYDNIVGRYDSLLHQASVLGPATTGWPGKVAVNPSGHLTDFRVGTTIQSKLPGWCDIVASELPWISGIFFDDLGSRSWFPDIDWNSAFTSTEKEAYRNGAIALAQTARDKADEHDWFIVCNGTFGAIGTSGVGDGGYPDRTLPGCSLFDGGGVEQHDPGSPDYWLAYGGATSQWGADTPRGLSYMFYMNTNPTDLASWNSKNAMAFGQQGDGSDEGYGTIYNPWGSFTDFGLPNRG